MRSSQTRTAVLGALSIEPMTGYAVREAIRETLGHFWSESFGQIYPALARLRDEGLVASAEAGRSGSSMHSLTAAGRRQLRSEVSTWKRYAEAMLKVIDEPSGG